jgi:Flp pilus assembly protein TadB
LYPYRKFSSQQERRVTEMLMAAQQATEKHLLLAQQASEKRMESVQKELKDDLLLAQRASEKRMNTVVKVSMESVQKEVKGIDRNLREFFEFSHCFMVGSVVIGVSSFIAMYVQ